MYVQNDLGQLDPHYGEEFGDLYADLRFVPFWPVEYDPIGW